MRELDRKQEYRASELQPIRIDKILIDWLSLSLFNGTTMGVTWRIAKNCIFR